ncbi:MAG: outer membrane beta-barrel protein [Ginsengibacter sp.]
MKKLILAFAVVAFTTLGAQAQDASKSTNLSIGVNVGLPTSSPSIYSLAFGADLQADFAVAPTTKITASAGYESYSIKSKYGSGNNYFIPVLAGAKFFFGDETKLYGHAQLGYGFAKGGSGAFAYAPSLGYYFSPNFDGSIKYLAFSKNGGTLGSLNLRLAYNF